MNITLSVSGDLEQVVKKNKHIKWTEIARAAIRKQAEKQRKFEILEKYMVTREVSDKDWEWMEKIDWHPVDELELKESFVKELEKANRKKSKKIKIKDFSERYGLK